MIQVQGVLSGFKKRRLRFRLVTFSLFLLTLLLALLALVLGNTIYGLDVVVRVLMGESIKGATFAIITLRLPRLLAGLLVGVAFGLAGSTFQTMLRNPLASPDIIGITSGSSVAAVFCIMVLNISGGLVAVSAVFAGLGVALIIYMLSGGGHFSGGRLILIGIGVQAMLGAIVNYLMLRGSQYDIPSAMRWLNGNLNGIQMHQLPMLTGVVLVFGGMVLLLSRSLMIMELGEASAITLGVRTHVLRVGLVISSVCLIAFATAVTGPVAFVAFLAGPIAKGFVGSGSAHQLPAGLVGAILVIGADIIGQFAFGTRFPVGIITGVLGAPYLLILLVRMNRKGGTA